MRVPFGDDGSNLLAPPPNMFVCKCIMQGVASLKCCVCSTPAFIHRIVTVRTGGNGQRERERGARKEDVEAVSTKAKITIVMIIILEQFASSPSKRH